MKTTYQLFIFDIAGEHEPIVAFESNTPFPALEVGQRFDDHGWDRLREVGKIASENSPIRYTVHSLKTTIFTENGVNICQTGVNVESFEGNRSPAFGNTKPTMSTKEALGK